MEAGISININRLGPIAGPVNVEIKPFMIFSGSSGVGKSYLALLVHYFYRVMTGEEMPRLLQSLDLNFEALRDVLPPEGGVLCKIPVQDFMKGLDKGAADYMRLMLGNPSLAADFEFVLPDMPEYFTFVFNRTKLSLDSGNVIEYVETIHFVEMGDKINLPGEMNWGELPFRFLLSLYFKMKFGLDNITQTFFMPPSRGSLIELPESVRAMVRGMYREFLDDMSAVKSYSAGVVEDEYENKKVWFGKATDVLHHNILHGDVSVEDDEIVYRMENSETPLPISATASSIKELAPFAIMMNKGFLGLCSTLFEEPEAHLHPELQVKVAELLCYSINAGAHLQITTHSDYLLRYINDMQRLGIIRQAAETDGEEALKTFKDFCEKNALDTYSALPQGCLAAYYLRRREDGLSEVIRQDASMGVPFDSFTKVIDENMYRSVNLYDEAESVMARENNDSHEVADI